MVTQLAEPLLKWLTDSKYSLSLFEGRRVVVVGIIGKSSGECSKAEPINRLLQLPAFMNSNFMKDSSASIDAYYAPELSTLFLLLTSYSDMYALEQILEREENKSKDFFELISSQETDHIRCLTFLLLYSHLLIYMGPGCRFDQSCCRDFKRANKLRLLCQRHVKNRLGDIMGFPNDWAVEGRLATPRCLFGFHRHLLRGDLNSTRKKESRIKLVEKLGQQSYRCMQLYDVIGANNRDYPCSLSRPTEPFVYIFLAGETYRNSIRDSLLMLIGQDNDKYEDIEENEVGNQSSDFGAFLKFHINLVRQEEERRRCFYAVPTLKWLLIGGKALYDLIFQSRIISNSDIDNICNCELLFSRSTEKTSIEEAKNYYMQTSVNPCMFTQPQVFTKKQHEAKLLRATEHLEYIYRGTKLSKAKEILKKECELQWAMEKACGFLSLYGNECSLPVHCSFSDVDVPASKRTSHSSGIRFLSACNCGFSQAFRDDPFSLREANYEFYMRPLFTCCKNGMSYEFVTFKPCNINNEALDDAASWDKSQKSLSCSKSSLVQLSEQLTEGEDLNMLLDGDNPLVKDEVRQKIAQSPRKSDNSLLQFIRATDVIKNEVEKVSISSDVEKSDELGFDETESNYDEEESVEEFEQSRIEEAHQKLVNGFESLSLDGMELNIQTEMECGVETEIEAETETHVSYLDDDDVQLREMDENIGKIDSAKDFEEKLLNLRESHQGRQFLECVPNTDSPSKRPLFPSWSLVCIGQSSLYSHRTGVRMSNSKSRSQFLTSVDVFLAVDSEKWEIDMRKIIGDTYGIRKRIMRNNGENQERVKLFIGFEYECPRGHQFIKQDMSVNIRVKDSKSVVTCPDISVWTRCSCRRLPSVSAQLMRLHVVTPKAPVAVVLNPQVQPTLKELAVYHTGEAPLRLDWARYYVLRFPFVYSGPNGPVPRPKEAKVMGKLFSDCIEVHYCAGIDC